LQQNDNHEYILNSMKNIIIILIIRL
jgi:hypothetical protein